MSLFVSYTWGGKDGQSGFGYVVIKADEPRGLEDIDAIVRAIKANDHDYDTIVVMNWKTFAPAPPD